MAVYNFKDANLNEIQFRESDLAYWRSRFFGNQFYITESNLCFLLIGTDQYLLMDLDYAPTKRMFDKYTISYDGFADPHDIRFTNKNQADTFGLLIAPNNKLENALQGVRYTDKLPLAYMEIVHMTKIYWVRDASNVFTLSPTYNYIVERGMDVNGSKIHQKSASATTSTSIRNYAATNGKCNLTLVNDPNNSGNTYTGSAQVATIMLDNVSKQLQIMTTKSDTDIVIKGYIDSSVSATFDDRNILRCNSNDKSTTAYGELYCPVRSHCELFLDTFTPIFIPASSTIIIPWDSMPVIRGTSILVHQTNGEISLLKAGLYHISAGFALLLAADVQLQISFVLRNAAGAFNTAIYAYGNKYGASMSHVLYINEPKVLTIRASTTHTSSLELSTGQRVGQQFTNCSVTFLG